MKFVEMTKFLAFKNWEKVVRSFLALINLYDHYFTKRLKIGYFILHSTSLMNNQNVEDFNSITVRMGSEYSEPTFENLYRDSLLVEVCRVVKSDQREELNLKSVSSSKGKGEIKRQENMHFR